MLDPEDYLHPTRARPPAGAEPTSLLSFAKLKNNRLQQYRILSGTALDLETGAELGPDVRPDWSGLVQAERKILKEESKSLQVAAWLAEDALRAMGIGCLPSGIRLFHRLQEVHGSDLHPTPDDDGDLWERAGIINGFASGLAAALKEASLAGAGGPSMLDWESASQGRGGSGPSNEAIASALEGLTEAERQALLDALDASQHAITALEAYLEEAFGGDDDVSLFPLKQMVDRCVNLTRRHSATDTVAGSQAVDKADQRGGGPTAGRASALTPTEEAQSTVSPRTLLQIPDIGPSSVAIEARLAPYREGLRLFQRAYDHSKTGRQRFFLRLELAEFCLEGGHVELARPLLTEIWGIAEKKTLQEWEDPQIWARLVAAQHKVALTPAERPSNQAAQALFDTLCRVDIERAYGIMQT